VFTGHLGRVGEALEQTVRAHHQAVGSLESRVPSAARRFGELGIAGGVPQIEPFATIARLPSGHGAGTIQAGNVVHDPVSEGENRDDRRFSGEWTHTFSSSSSIGSPLTMTSTIPSLTSFSRRVRGETS
jgi:hypothetical protein